MTALKAMHEYGVWQRRPARQVVRFPVNRRRVERIIYRRQRTDRLRQQRNSCSDQRGSCNNS